MYSWRQSIIKIRQTFNLTLLTFSSLCRFILEQHYPFTNTYNVYNENKTLSLAKENPP